VFLIQNKKVVKKTGFFFIHNIIDIIDHKRDVRQEAKRKSTFDSIPYFFISPSSSSSAVAGAAQSQEVGHQRGNQE